MIEEGLVVFFTTHEAIKSDDLLLKKNVEASLIPTHPSVSLGCGFMLKTSWQNFANVVKILDEEGVKYRALYYSTKEKIKRHTTLLYENKNNL